MKKRLLGALLCFCLLMPTFAASPVMAGLVDDVETGMYICAEYNSNIMLNADHTFSSSINWGEGFVPLSGTWRSITMDDSDPPIAIFLTATSGNPQGGPKEYTLSTYPGRNNLFVQDGVLGILPADTMFTLTSESLPAPTTASGEYKILTIDFNTNKYTSFGNPFELSAGSPAPFIDENNNTMIPVRFLEEAGITGYVEYEAASKKISIYNLDTDIVMYLGSPEVHIDNVAPITMYDAAGKPAAPRVINGRAYLPLRALMTTALGYSHIEYSNGVVTVYAPN